MARPTVTAKRRKQAKELATNETLLWIFAEREREIYERWKASEDTASRELCFYDITALEGLRDAIDATTGE